eukprot:TRINITY_DN9933_c1_g1_i1.p1 TRINITY_DN9933_c1_g1~~TRINITY_DN9933_c1_g1_i1.p1  ORF type:complete len:723 (+),score=217.21 TRINITY_DN9933_c1_g1_i1:220-2169(+)
MTSRKLNDEVFGDGKLVPSRKLFLERLPDPDEFAAVALETAERNLEAGAEDAQQIYDEVRGKDPMALLHDEIIHVLETSIKDPRINMCIDPLTEMFLGCAVVTCATLDEAERALTNLTGRWLLPPQTDQSVQLHYIDDTADPKVSVEGLGPGTSVHALRELLSHYGSVEEIDARERKDRRGIESATVKFATIEDAYTAISIQHGCPIPPAIYDLEMQGVPEDLLPSLAHQLSLNDTDIAILSGPDEVPGSSRYTLTVSIPPIVSPEQVTQLIENTEEPRVTGVLPPPAVTLRLPKRRKKIRPEDQEQLVCLDDKLKLEKEKTMQLEKELRNVLEPQLKAKKDAADKASAELEAMKQATGWDERKQFSTHTQMDRENEISELLSELSKLQTEQASLRNDNTKKTALIEKLAKSLQRKEEVQREHDSLQEQLRDKEVEYQDRVENVRTLKRILNKKGKLTDDMIRADDTREIKGLESDKKVLQHEITRHGESRRAAEKTIQAQHHRLTQLDNRIRAIASALRELHDPSDESSALFRPPSYADDEHVPFAIYQAIQQELSACRKKLMQKDQAMLERDANIEALEKKIDILLRAKSSNMKRANRDHKHLQNQYEIFHQFKIQQQHEAECKKEEIQQDTDDLERKYKRIVAAVD